MNALASLYTSTMPAPIIIALLVVSWRAGQRAWLYADFFGTMFFGISLLLTPRLLLEYQTEVHLDNVSLYLARVIGLFLLSMSMHSHRAFAVGNMREWGAIATSRTVAAIMLLLATVYAHQHYTEWNFRFAPLAIAGPACWLLPNLYYALFTVSAARPESEAVTFFLLLDYFMTAAVGLAWYAYPQWLLRMQIEIQPNGVSVTLARILGAFLVGLSLGSNAATCFTDLSSKKFIHLSRIGTCVPLLGLVLYSETLARALTTTHTLVGVCAVSVWATNSALGYLTIAYVELAAATKHRARAAAKQGSKISKTPSITGMSHHF